MKPGNCAGVLIGSLSLLFLSACVTTYFNPAANFESGRYAAVSPAAVRVLRSVPYEPYQTLGDIRVETAPFHDWEAVILKVRERAATIGADAVIFKDARSAASGTSGYEEGGAGLSNRTKTDSVTFAAIRVLSEDSAQRRLVVAPGK